MFQPQLSLDQPSAFSSALEGSQILSLLRTFELRVDAAVSLLYAVLRDYSPFPVEVSILTLVLLGITVRQIVLWFKFDAVTRHTYVYWKIRDTIENGFSNGLRMTEEQHLANAVLLYITQRLWREKPLAAAELQNKSFMVNLLSLYSKADEDDEYASDDDAEVSFRQKEHLMVPVKLPIYPYWTATHQDEVEVCTWMSTMQIKSLYPVANRSVFLRMRKGDATNGGAAADAALRRFVEDALHFYFSSGYCDQEQSLLRVYRTLPSIGRVGVLSSPLPLGPTLDTVFFRQREEVKALLRRFSDHQGRYAIQGFPRKLGFLLYGPRGTGKRSFVRALAYHTQRHIVRIPLSSLTSNEQLFNIFYFEAARAGSAEEWSMLTSKKVIFLIEDVDTHSQLVRARGGAAHVAHVRRPRGLTTRDVAELDSGAAAAAADGATGAAVRGGKVATGPRARLKAPEAGGGWGRLFSRESDGTADTASLSTLLNVLDGAVEQPERIVVMIAEHPERLDPALLRPGRLATHLRFDYLELDDLVRLCGLFFGEEVQDRRGTLTANGAAKVGVSCAYGRLETRDAPASRDLRDSLLEVSERREASPPHCDDPGSGEADAEWCLNWHRATFAPYAAATRVQNAVLRQLTHKQELEVRACVTALEQEAEKASAHGGESSYNFLITPGHAHHMCMQATHLRSFLKALAAYIRGGSCKR